MNQARHPAQKKDPIKVTGLTRWLRGWRRRFSSVEWAVTWLGLPRGQETATEPGLILLHIDGVSQALLREALDLGHMPFLKSLVDAPEYDLLTIYSGLPSNWAAAEVELFYGLPGAIPGSHYYDRKRQELVHWVRSSDVVALETEWSAMADGLLRDGSSYGNGLAGGATERHFCGTSPGWDDIFRDANPLHWGVTALLHVGMAWRWTVQACRELLDSRVLDPIRPRRSWWRRCREIPDRLNSTVWLREWSTLGACYDAARGLPVIHVNFIGYDEVAHRFGPGTRQAYRQLRAIDRSTRKIWRAAHLGRGREYDVWFFSGHGHERTVPSTTVPCPMAGQRLMERLRNGLGTAFGQTDWTIRFDGLLEVGNEDSTLPRRGVWLKTSSLREPQSAEQSSREGADLVTTDGERRVAPTMGVPSESVDDPQVDIRIVPAGTIAHVYLGTARALAVKLDIGRWLATDGMPPLVLLTDEVGQPVALVRDQTLGLPDQSVQVFGADHPHCGRLGADAVRLIQHEHSGDLILAGWNGPGDVSNYLPQAGGHHGVGPEETSGFAVLPCDIRAMLGETFTVRPSELRQAAIRVLDSKPLLPPQDRSEVGVPVKGGACSHQLRVMTYNIHGAVGMDGELSPDRIARVISQARADVVCLQEVDRNRPRSQGIDQLKRVADILEMHWYFVSAWENGPEAFGNGILSRFPLREQRAELLKRQKESRSGRAALWMEGLWTWESTHRSERLNSEPGLMEVSPTSQSPGVEKVQFINTHLSIYPQEQRQQASELVAEWLEPAKSQGQVVLCGDFNASPQSTTWKILSESLTDVAHSDPLSRRQPTYFSPYPMLRVDHIFMSNGLQAASQVIRSRLARVASDHLPVIADLRPKLPSF